MTAAAALRMQIRPPRFALLPAATPPRGGLLLSALAHTVAVFSVLTWLPLLFPGRSVIVARTTADILRDPDEQVLMLPALPRISDAGSRDDLLRELKKMSRSLAMAKAKAGRAKSSPPKPDYADPQIIVSNLPEWNNNIQTILRPDLLAPPKLKYPVRLQSMMMLPAPTAPTRVVPKLEQPAVATPVGLVPFQASNPHIQVPLLPMGAPERSSAVPAEQVAPAITGATDQSLPALPGPVAPALPALGVSKAVVVLNAVNVPVEPVPVIPDAVLAGRFILAPSRNASAPEAPSGTPGAEIAVAGASKAEGKSLRSTVGNESGTGVETGRENSGTALSGSASGKEASPGSGGGTITIAGSTSLPGISISGGSTVGGSRPLAISPMPRHSYGLTIISGGSSGGASRDLGVFARGDTVYTVYIPMEEAGGGPDWPMEYARANSAPASNGLLTPPVALKKIQATAAKADSASNSAPVFVTGIIDENGKLKFLRALHALDVRADAAVNALSQWEFLAAQLEGKPVASKVLIGVTVMPAKEIAKQN